MDSLLLGDKVIIRTNYGTGIMAVMANYGIDRLSFSISNFCTALLLTDRVS
jgi:hypothetical protein